MKVCQEEQVSGKLNIGARYGYRNTSRGDEVRAAYTIH